MTTLHYAAGGGLDDQGNFAPAAAGFNLADVQYVDQVNALPDGVQGLVWLDQYQGVTQDFIDQVTPFLNNPKVFGFYLVDEPDMTGEWGPQADPADLMAESDWIHQHDPDAKTFTVLMNMGSADDPNYMNSYNQENTHIDYFGLDWYPVWTDRPDVDVSTIDKYVAAAEQAGIPLDSIVPAYQAFGGGGWTTETGSHHVMPTAEQEQAMIDRWAELVPNPAFDYAYAWGSQNGDTALESSPELQQVFLAHNTSEGTSTGGTTVPPVTDPVTDTPPVADAGGDTGTDGTTTPPVADASGDTGTDGTTTPPVADAGGDTGTDGTTTPPVADASGDTGTDGTTTPPVADAGGSTGTDGTTTPPVADAGGSTGSTPPVSGSDGTTDPSTGGTTDTGGWGGHHRGNWSGGWQTSDGDGGHCHRGGGLDFSQWINAATSSASGDHSWWRGHNATSTTTADAASEQADTSDTGSFAAHLADLMSHHNDHHAWHS
ncbi:calcium-binding protein [Bradyrhizobium cajani]|uniref:calcium-binding protein n=1 Tax=Bradyrhizobium cajani TaxID=1928661 RepID=UPI00197A785C|nr:calcium-binding protein [Bradyrhizobium cajani]MCP3369529.1 calcium-binding protein [Bradyrhizobium cajani]